MRAIWSGALSFGLVNIPVKVYPASEDKGLDLRMLHQPDLSPIKYARICRADGKEVPWDEIVKGYEYTKGDYVVLTDEDFEKANVRKTKTVDIVDFTEADEIDPIYYEKPYFLEPDKGADKAYALLREALNRSKRVGVAKFVIRNRERLGIIRPLGRVLMLEQIRFPMELRTPFELKIPETKVADEKEIEMALKLIDQLTEPFKAEDYHDTYTEELQTIIDKKAKGKKVTAKGQAPQPTQVKDLMATLRASLEAANKK